MLKIEEKFIAWINKHIELIAFAFVIFAAIWMRIVGRNYMGIDYHYSLYDIPGNCNSLLFRTFVGFIMARWTDSAIIMLKILAYLGDLGVAFLTLLLLYKVKHGLKGLQALLAATVCLLSPVSLIYSVSGMKIDSVCMCFILLGLLLYLKKKMILSVSLMALSAFIYPAYWPIVIILTVCMSVYQKKKNEFGLQNCAALAVLFCLLLFSVFWENLGAAHGYYWGKIFVFNPAGDAVYSDIGTWLSGMCKIYGYFFAMFSLVLSLEYRKLRIPALLLQLLVLMFAGWTQTAHLAL